MKIIVWHFAHKDTNNLLKFVFCYRLFRYVKGQVVRYDRYQSLVNFEIGLSQAFLEYGLWQDFGTGKEIPRGNSGDIGREKRRVAKKWFSRKYYSSVLNLRDFLADNIGQSFVGVVAKALDDNYRRYNH